MGFLKRLFGGGERPDDPAAGADGFFVYVQCDRCGAGVRLRIHKQHDLNRTDGGYSWHKTVVDSRCFRPIPTAAYFDNAFNMTEHEIQGGHYITRAQYDELEAQRAAASRPEEPKEDADSGQG
jgi:hypothetical protein